MQRIFLTSSNSQTALTLLHLRVYLKDTPAYAGVSFVTHPDFEQTTGLMNTWLLGQYQERREWDGRVQVGNAAESAKASRVSKPWTRSILRVRPGTVHALMGENGAGKSTLMKCLFGIYKMDEGEVYLDGKKMTILAIRMMHYIKDWLWFIRSCSLIPERTIAENMYLGRYPTEERWDRFRCIDHKTMNEEADKWLENVKMPYDPKAKLGTLIYCTDAVCRDRKGSFT